MRKLVLLVLSSAVLFGCNLSDETAALGAMGDDEQVWVFAQFNVPEEGDKIDSYYYYGKVAKSLYDRVSGNTLHEGFVLMEEVRYWGDNDLIYEFRDKENTGDLVFRIEDIRRIKQVRNEPIAGRGYEQFEEPQVESEQTALGDEAPQVPGSTM